MQSKLKTTLLMLTAAAGIQAQTIATTGDTLYSAMNKGVGKSTDKGNTWVMTGYTQTPVNCVIVTGGKVYAGTKSGALVSGNGGTNWTKLTGNDVKDSNFVGFAVDVMLQLRGLTNKSQYVLGTNWIKKTDNISSDTTKKAIIGKSVDFYVISETKMYKTDFNANSYIPNFPFNFIHYIQASRE